jgi:hypothetical protein
MYSIIRARSMPMKRSIASAAAIALCALLGGCFGGSAPSIESAPPALTQGAPTAQAGGLDAYSYGHAAEIYADPDAYTGKTYSSLFMVGEKQEYEGKTVYYAAGYKKDTSLNTITVFDFGNGEAPDVASGEIVYAWGVIEGGGFISDESGSTTAAMWLGVGGMEFDVSKADIRGKEKTYSFKDGEYTAKSGTLSIEVMSLGFSQDAMMLNTKTSDTSVKNTETYYFDIMIHQDGYYAFYPGCDFWMQPDGMVSFDNIPFSVLDSAKDIKIGFMPFGEDGSLICGPLTIEIKLGEYR